MKTRTFFSILILLVFLLTPALAQQPRYISVVIASGEAVSSAINTSACTPIAMEVATQTSAGWTTANLTVLATVDGTNYRDVYDSYAVEYTILVPSTAANSAPVHIRINPPDLWGIYSFKLRSGTTGTPVNQAAARTIRVVCK